MPVNDISFWSPCEAYLEVSGKDATSFLHRLSTQDFERAPSSQWFSSCFLDPRGRLIDVVYAQRVETERWILLSSHQKPDKLLAWLNQYWFSEKIELKDTSKAPGCQFLIPPLSEFDRIKNTLPKAQNEINESYNPLEIGLEDCISSNKGCYVGQEVIARLAASQKISRKLFGVSCLEKDFELLKKAPEITSSLENFKENQTVALGIFKKSTLTPEGFVTTGNGVKVWVVSSAR